jgi:hypothetical protein
MKQTPGVYSFRNNTANTACLGKGNEQLIDPRHRMITKNLPSFCNNPRQKGAQCFGPVFGPSWVCRSCWCNFHNAICNRHGKIAPPVISKFPHATAMLRAHKEQVGMEFALRMAYWEENWLLKWPLKKQENLLRSQKFDPLKFSSVKSFVKREPGHKKVTKARGIQGYANHYTQLALGPHVYAMQKAVGHVFDFRQGHRHNGIGITVASGMNATDLGDWMTMVHKRFGNPWFYERDGANWDATMQAPHQDLVNILYENFPQLTFDNIQKCRNVKGTCVTRGGNGTVQIKYELQDTTKSGHNDTSLRNSVINACTAYETFMTLGVPCEMIVMGDDLLVAMGREIDEVAAMALEASMGITPEAGLMDSYTKVTFISGHWIQKKDGSFVFAPLLGRLLLRLYWTARQFHDVRAFAYSIAEGLKPAVGEFPIYRALLDQPKARKIDTGVSAAHMQIWNTTQTTDESVLAHMCERYSTVPSDIYRLEELIRQNITEPVLIVDPLATEIIRVDLLEVHMRG